MLEKKLNLKTSDLLTLLSWLKSENVAKNKNFKFNNLLGECLENNTGEVNVDGFLDDLMYELFNVYTKIKDNSSEIRNKIQYNTTFNILPKDMLDETMRSLKAFVELYETLLLNSKFENKNIREIQKTLFQTMLDNSILNEEYEKCVVLKEKLETV